MNADRTPGKLLLFGEYTVLLGGKALAMPLPHLYGYWAYSQVEPELDLMPFAEHLSQLRQGQQLLAPLDTESFKSEVAKGLFFKSNIPVGYGAGSSGALCAAVYERFAVPGLAKNDEQALSLLQRQLAQMERFFHGQSSGTDPLICYLKQALLIDGKTIRPIETGDRSAHRGCFFLMDTGISRRTAPLVQRFKAKCEDGRFRESAMQQLAQPTAVAIDAYLYNEEAVLEKALSQISAAQLLLLPDFIPGPFHSIWSQGLKQRQFYLKLCGAGGGGFLIGYAPNGHLPEGIPPGIRSPLPGI